MTNKKSPIRTLFKISSEKKLRQILEGKKYLIIGIGRLNQVCESYNLLGMLTTEERSTLAQFFGQVRLICLYDDIFDYRNNNFYNIGMFANASSLEFVKIDINHIRSFDLVQPGLKSLTFHKCPTNLTTTLKDYSWSFLEDLSITQCRDVNLTSSLRFLYNLKKLELVLCSLTSVGDRFEHLSRLENLNLSFNMLETLPSLAGQVKLLKLRGNRISSLEWIGRLPCLTFLDVSLNNIEQAKAIEDVSLLKNLKNFDFSGNPLAFVPKCRAIVLKCVFWWTIKQNLPIPDFILNGRAVNREDRHSVNSCDYQLCLHDTKKTITLNLSKNLDSLFETVQKEEIKSPMSSIVESAEKSISETAEESSNKSTISDVNEDFVASEEIPPSSFAEESEQMIELADSFKVFESTGTLGRTSKELILSFNDRDSLSIRDRLSSYEIKIPFSDVLVERNASKDTIQIKTTESAKTRGGDFLDMLQLSFEGIREIQRFDHLIKICGVLRNQNAEITTMIPPAEEAISFPEVAHFSNIPLPEPTLEVLSSSDEEEYSVRVSFLSKMWGDGKGGILGDPDVVRNIGSILAGDGSGDLSGTLGNANKVGTSAITYLIDNIFRSGEHFIFGVECPLLDLESDTFYNGTVVLSDRRILMFERLQNIPQLRQLEDRSVEHILKLVIGFGHCSFYFSFSSCPSKFAIFSGNRSTTEKFADSVTNVLENSFEKCLTSVSMRKHLIKAYLYQKVNLQGLTNRSDLFGVYRLWTGDRGNLADMSFFLVFSTNSYVAMLAESKPFRPEGVQMVPFTTLRLHCKINIALMTALISYPRVNEWLLTVEYTQGQSVMKKKESLNLLFTSADDLNVFVDFVVSAKCIKRVERESFFIRR